MATHVELLRELGRFDEAHRAQALVKPYIVGVALLSAKIGAGGDGLHYSAGCMLTCKGKDSAFVRMTRIVVLALSFVFGPAYADEQVVTYIEYEGRYIELTDSWLPAGNTDGTMMAIDAKEISTSENYDRLDHTSLAVHPWKQVGEWVVIYFKSGEKRFHSSTVITKLVNRPWTNEPISLFQTDLA